MEFSRVKMGRRNNKRFNYKPRYYNEDKESLENRKELIKAEVTGVYSSDASKLRIQSAYKNRGVRPLDPAAQQQRMVSRVRILLIALILGSIAYMVFYTDTLPVIISGFKKIQF